MITEVPTCWPTRARALGQTSKLQTGFRNLKAEGTCASSSRTLRIMTVTRTLSKREEWLPGKSGERIHRQPQKQHLSCPVSQCPHTSCITWKRQTLLPRLSALEGERPGCVVEHRAVESLMCGWEWRPGTEVFILVQDTPKLWHGKVLNLLFLFDYVLSYSKWQNQRVWDLNNKEIINKRITFVIRGKNVPFLSNSESEIHNLRI